MGGHGYLVGAVGHWCSQMLTDARGGVERTSGWVAVLGLTHPAYADD
jgi:hypothetical protein